MSSTSREHKRCYGISPVRRNGASKQPFCSVRPYSERVRTSKKQVVPGFIFLSTKHTTLLNTPAPHSIPSRQSVSKCKPGHKCMSWYCLRKPSQLPPRNLNSFVSQVIPGLNGRERGFEIIRPCSPEHNVLPSVVVRHLRCIQFFINFREPLVPSCTDLPTRLTDHIRDSSRTRDRQVPYANLHCLIQ